MKASELYPLMVLDEKLAGHELVGVHHIQQLLPGCMLLVQISPVEFLHHPHPHLSVSCEISTHRSLLATVMPSIFRKLAGNILAVKAVSFERFAWQTIEACIDYSKN